MGIVVLGSANRDLVYRVPELPRPGQTVLATAQETHLGGKGANQAVAAARAGGSVTFIGSVGGDEHGAMITAGLAEAGVDTLLRSSDRPTGTAMITVDDAGENSIIVDAGANADLTDLTRTERSVITEASALLLQLEIPLPTVAAAARHAHAQGVRVLLNAAPMTELPDGLLADVDLLIINETEAAQLSGRSDPYAAVDELTARTGQVIITLGAAGALVATAGHPVRTVSGLAVDVVDTTGAGDAFCGATAAELVRRGGSGPQELIAAAESGNRAAALAVQRVGAQPPDSRS